MILPREKSIYLCRDSGKVAKGEGIYQPDADHESREGHLARCNNQHFKNEVRLFRNLCNPVSGQKESTQASCYCGHQDTEPGRYIVNSLQYIKSQCRFKKYVPSLFIFSISSLALIYVLPDPIQQRASNHPRSKVDRSIHSYSQSVIAGLAIWARAGSPPIIETSLSFWFCVKARFFQWARKPLPTTRKRNLRRFRLLYEEVQILITTWFCCVFVS